jgi:hypothetical protein
VETHIIRDRSVYKVEWFLNELGEPFVRVNVPENMSLTLDEARDFGNGLIEAWQLATQATKGRGTD